ncbi:hypothetical protein EVAR_87941_1 [Eumeta japonica]|uniref:Uncharacterized protein n=1 Tax=Eumeta variegata TaxID=151549 RepID=A0A4C1T0Q4_EUMVA|nr:hypothetical protein EVAR_87941_1 [Eumeta japonica]
MDISASREGGAALTCCQLSSSRRPASRADSHSRSRMRPCTDERCERASSLYHPSTPVEGISRSGMFTHPAGDRTAIVSLKETTFAYGSARVERCSSTTIKTHIASPSFSLTPRINSDSCQTRQARQRRQPAWAAHERRVPAATQRITIADMFRCEGI